MPLCVCGQLASELKPKERVLAEAFLEAAARVCTRLSYRDSVDTLNRFLRRKGEETVKLRTLSNSMQRMGKEISWELMTATERVLLMYGFDPETGLPKGETTALQSIAPRNCPENAVINEDTIRTVVDSINAEREEKILHLPQDIPMEAYPDTCVYLSIDNIGVKRQKSERQEGSTRSSKFVENTVAHIQYGKETYVLTAIGMDNLFKSVLAFLLANDLLQYELVFLTDGARDLKNRISTIFAFHPYIHILDWYHLKKKCMELLSMAICGKDQRNSTLEKLLRILWVGNVDSAKSYLSTLPSSYIKSQKWLDEVIAYLDRKADRILCYAVRAKLGLRISSNPVEKTNDLLVAQRQKHNGMAWSPNGSGSLAVIEMIYRNAQEAMWFKDKQLLGFTSSCSHACICT